MLKGERVLRSLGLRRKRDIWGYTFVAPWIILTSVFMAYPFTLAFKMSFQRINVLQPQDMRFVGLGNWIKAIHDPLFWQSLFNVAYNQVIFISCSFAIALTFALLLKEATKFTSVLRTIYFLPVVTSVPAAMIVFSFFVAPNGFVQSALINWGIIHQPVYWTFSKWLPMPILAAFSSWKWFGVQTIIFLGGLYAINNDLYEAAEVDGAGFWKKFRHITVPQLNKQIVFILTINIINGLQMFTEVYMNFNLDGGPYHAGLTPVLYLYAEGFDKLHSGYAATVGLLLAIIIFILTRLQMKLVERED